MCRRVFTLAMTAFLLGLCGACATSDLTGGVGGGSAGPQEGGTSDAGGSSLDCVPKTCAELGVDCGQQPDSCGGVVNCGTCTAPDFCGGGGPSHCGTGACVKQTCAELGASCGQQADGCGGLLSCGTCSAPETCGGGGTPNVCGGGSQCVKKTCADFPAGTCGEQADGCGGLLSCGTCSAPATCGGAGAPNVCGTPKCTPQTCAGLSYDCGQVADGCGGLLSCGTCSAPETCGGAGTPNVCGTPPAGCLSGDATWNHSEAFAAQTGTFTASFDATPSQTSMDGVVGFSQGPAAAYTDLASIVRFNSGGTIDTRDGGSYRADASVPYTAGSTYHFRMVVDLPQHTYTAYVTPPGGTEVTLGSNYSFRTEQASVTSLDHVNAYASSGSENLCNFSVQASSGGSGGTGGSSGMGGTGGTTGGSGGTVGSGGTSGTGGSIGSGTAWYVDNSAPAGGDGKSWSTAWNDFASIQWSSMSPGDVLYISGGASSQTYSGGMSIPQGTEGITITKGVDGGHNGQVILNGPGSASGNGIRINGDGAGAGNITISHLTVQNFNIGIYGYGEHTGGMHNILVDACRVLNFGRAGIFFTGWENTANNVGIVVRNSYLNDDNAYTSQSDGIYVQYLHDFTADHNTIVLDNSVPSCGDSCDVHSDNIQSFWVDNDTYSNNIAIQQCATKTNGTQLLFAEEGNGTHRIYNNVVFRNDPLGHDAAIRLKRNTGTFHAIVYGNSVYLAQDQAINTDDPNTVVENNIFYSKGSTYHKIDVQYGSGTGSGAVEDYNVFYNPGMTNSNTGSGSHDVSADPMYTNTGNENTVDLRLQNGSPAIDSGTALGSPYSTDILGVSRPQGAGWDIGAYER